MVDARSSFNSPKAHSIDVQIQAMLFNGSAVSFRLIELDKLTTVVVADIVLFATSLSIFTDISRFALRGFHLSNRQRLLVLVFRIKLLNLQHGSVHSSYNIHNNETKLLQTQKH